MFERKGPREIEREGKGKKIKRRKKRITEIQSGYEPCKC